MTKIETSKSVVVKDYDLTKSYKNKNSVELMIQKKELQDNIPVILLSSVYVGEEQKIYLIFYDPVSEEIMFWKDNTNHKPYCYAKVEEEEKILEIIRKEKKFSITHVKRNDLVFDQEIDLIKILAPDPLSIGGTDSSIREKISAYEADIKYHENYLYDNLLIPGTYYIKNENKIDQYRYSINTKININTEIFDNSEGRYELNETDSKNYEYNTYIQRWVELLNQPIPDLKRIAIDIEVESEEGRIPNPRDHDKRIIAVGICGSHDFRKILVLRRENKPNFKFANNYQNQKTRIEEEIQLKEQIPDIELFDTEFELLSAAFKIMNMYPAILTYNGDDFDLPYLYARSQDPNIDPINKKIIQKEDIPIIIKKENFVKRGMQAEPIHIKNGIHLDLFRLFQNRSVQIYAFSNKYSEYTLNAISEALLNDNKVDFEGDISDLPTSKLAEYCLKDADLTYRLTSFNDNLLMKLLIVISRIARLPVDDVSRFGVNQWIRGLLYYEHRFKNALIPRRNELTSKGGSSTEAIIKEKKYRGGLVVNPTLGIHFNVVVVDFASLYPSIIKVHNLSYETVNCHHNSCINDPNQKISGTNHWICKKRRGITSLLIGSLRDLRVNYYKHLSKDKKISQEERQLFNVVSQAIKVILNASYGVMGAEIFPLYCLPVAEATAALGRDITTKTINKCQKSGIEVIYGDTDSLFLKNPTKEKVEEISLWAKNELGVDLEIDKFYRYVVFSELKKNYLGVLDDGTVDVKGLTGKKSHTPPFIRKAFYKILDILREVNSEKDFEFAKEKIKKIIQANANDLENGKISPAELSFNVMINKSPERYGQKILDEKHISLTNKEKNVDYIVYKGLPQHIKAAKLLQDSGKEIKAGDIISYVKTKTNDGVKPVDLVKNISEIDTEKYLDAMESTFDQVLSSLNYNFRTILGKHRQTNLDELFWNKN